MGRNKQLAESQFDASAAPISLGHNFSNFFAYHLDQDTFVEEDEATSYISLFNQETEDLPLNPESLILIANDLDPVKRDEFANLVENTDQEEFDPLAPFASFYQDDIPDDDIRIYPDEHVENLDFQTEHARIKEEIQESRIPNQVTAAFRLVNLAIDKMPDRKKTNFGLETPEDRRHSHPRQALIDKSTASIEFINQLGFNILDHFSKIYPNRIRNLISDESTAIDWLNHSNPDKKLDSILACAYMATRLKYSNIELNDCPGLNMGITNTWRHLTSYNLLHILNLHTIHVDSIKFHNFEKVVKNFPKIHGGKRLFYLEYLVSEAKFGNLFFDSNNDSFFDSVGCKGTAFSSLDDRFDKWPHASNWLNSLFDSPSNLHQF